MNASSSMLVAVASKDRSKVDLHFGHADDFHIYRLEAAGPAYVEHRALEEYAPEEGVTDDNRRDVVLKTIADCAALFVARAGDGPTKKLKAAGIEPVVAYADAPVEDALKDWLAKRA